MERWVEIKDFPGYEVSDLGNVRTYWYKHKKKGVHGGSYRSLEETPRIVPQSDDGNGYQKVFLNNGKTKRCIKVHRLVAEAFIPNDESFDTVDHIKSGKEGKLDNSVKNLRWISRRSNIQKAYRDGMCDDRINSQKIPLVIIDTWTGEEQYFDSVRSAADFIGVDYTTISHALSECTLVRKRYDIYKASREDKMLYGIQDY